MADEVDEALAAREAALRADLRSLVDGRAVRASARRAHMVLHAPPARATCTYRTRCAIPLTAPPSLSRRL